MFLWRKSLINSNVVKLIPTAIGPLTQFILRPLKKPPLTPSFLYGREKEVTLMNVRFDLDKAQRNLKKKEKVP